MKNVLASVVEVAAFLVTGMVMVLLAAVAIMGTLDTDAAAPAGLEQTDNQQRSPDASYLSLADGTVMEIAGGEAGDTDCGLPTITICTDQPNATHTIYTVYAMNRVLGGATDLTVTLPQHPGPLAVATVEYEWTTLYRSTATAFSDGASLAVEWSSAAEFIAPTFTDAYDFNDIEVSGDMAAGDSNVVASSDGIYGPVQVWLEGDDLKPYEGRGDVQFSLAAVHDWGFSAGGEVIVHGHGARDMLVLEVTYVSE